MAALDRVMELDFRTEDEEYLVNDKHDWGLSRALHEKRHTEKIEGTETSPHTWRMKERMKTVSVALVMCLNVGVDPPGIVKTQPCARLECWIDPLNLSPQKALETIGTTLQKQYERWQPRARYKQSLDPTVEEVKKLCSSLRRNAKDERVLFHYNGHGVPQPTNNGEIWVFNRNYTQYIPLSVYDLQTWMGSPSIYVYDCSNAGLIIKSFHQFAEQHEREYEEALAKSSALSACPPPNFSGCIQLGACGETQILPMNSDLPADLFTTCLTTPIRIALRWFLFQNKDKLIPNITLEMMDKIPGQLSDRRTMLGELNWIFTAITDTIAWNTLPRQLFQRLFRQDLLVASLFRNYLLAERIMRSYDCTPTSSPKLPPTAQHPMWAAWDFSLDLCLSQLPKVLEEIATNQQNGNGNSPETMITNHQPSPFFEEQLTAFQVWLEFGSENRNPPEQLPIVLQVLLSQVHRVRALELLGRFLDLGWWAVNLALSVGIFPYVLKLLQSSARELRPLLVFIWAKILAVDHSCQSDLVRDHSHKYFILMVGDNSLPFEHRTMAVFVLTNIVRDFRPGQQAALTSNCISTCLEALDESDMELRRWVCICLGLTWQDFAAARWVGVRDSAHEKIYSLLEDPNPEVRAAAVFALGTFINSGSERTEHANAIDHSVAMTIVTKLLGDEASPLVRQEIVVALHNFVLVFENNFVAIEQHTIITHEAQLSSSSSPVSGGTGMKRISSQVRMKILNSSNQLATVTGALSSGENRMTTPDAMPRVASCNSLSSLFHSHHASSSPIASSSVVGGIYGKVWAAMATYEKDSYPGVALLAHTVMEYIRQKAREAISSGGSGGAGSSIAGGSVGAGGGGLIKPQLGTTTSPLRPASQSSMNSSSNHNNNNTIGNSQHHHHHHHHNSLSQSPNDPSNTSINSGGGDATKPKEITPLIGTKYIEWCWDRFARPSIPGHGNGIGFASQSTLNSVDPQDPINHAREWRYMRNAQIRKDCIMKNKNFPGKIEDQIFSSKNVHSYGHGNTPGSSSASSPSFSFSSHSCPSIVKLHDYEKLMICSEISMISLYEMGDTNNNRLVSKWENSNDARITSIEWINAHDESLVMVGGDDGTVRIWNPDGDKTKPLTSWNALSDVGHLNKSSKSSGLIVKWDPEKERVLAVGDSRLIRVWDVKTELKKGDWPTGFDSPATSIEIHRCEPHLAVVGLEEGAVRLIDFRLPPAECGTMTWRDFGESWIVNVSLRHDRQVVAGSAAGKIRFYDVRTKLPTKTVEVNSDITALAIHPNLPYFASGCVNHTVNVYGFFGHSAFICNSIKDGLFVSGRMGAVSSLHFHTYKAVLASADSYSVNVYKSKTAWW